MLPKKRFDAWLFKYRKPHQRRLCCLTPPISTRRQKNRCAIQEIEKVLDQSTLSAMKQILNSVRAHTVERDSTTTLLLAVSVITSKANGMKSTQSASGSRKPGVIDSLQNTQNKTETLRSETVNLSQKDPQNKLKCVSLNISIADSSRLFEFNTAFPVPRPESHTLSLNRPAVNHQWSHL